ncbi:MAG: hypothetical protein R6X05_13190 [Desulfobacterales bacterium]|jgi:hypothetical protein
MLNFGCNTAWQKVLGILLIALWAGLATGTARADAYEALYPLLVDLPGWQAEEPSGMNMSISGMAMVNASRSYTRGDSELTALIMKGGQAEGLAAAAGAGLQMETAESRISTQTIDGFVVQTVHDKTDNTGTVMVFLDREAGTAAIFSVSYGQMAAEDALEQTRAFDWAQIRQGIRALP